MLKTRKELETKIKSLCRRSIAKPKEIKKHQAEISERYGISISTVSDVLTIRAELSSQSDFVLFAVMSVLDEKSLREYFTQQEIEYYSKEKLEKESIKFPIRLPMIKISEDQWIGRITVKQLMMFRDAQLIRYNENAQRTMRHIINGNTEYYKIYLNKKAVGGIQESYNNETYIPNTITLNMPEDTVYDYKNNELSIYNISQFDILDGYHRYIAMSKIFNMNKDFDYNMELRIVLFQEGKARQFIWQEDQKTKMVKARSDSFNQNLEANKIVQQLNVDSSFVLCGQILKDGGIIDSAVLAKLIDVIWFDKKESREATIKKGIEVRKTLKEKIQYIVDSKPEIIEKQWSVCYTTAVVTCISMDIPNNELLQKIEEVVEQQKYFNITISMLNKRTINKIRKITEV